MLEGGLGINDDGGGQKLPFWSPDTMSAGMINANIIANELAYADFIYWKGQGILGLLSSPSGPTRADSPFPLGTGGYQYDRPLITSPTVSVVGIPGVVQRTSALPVGLPQPPVRKTKLPTKTPLLWENVLNPTKLFEGRMPVNVAPLPRPPVITSPPTAVGGLGTTKLNPMKGSEMAIDLGNLLGKALDVYGASQHNAGMGAVYTPTGAAPAANDSSSSGPFGIPGVEVISESKLDAGLVYKKVCGQYRWVKQKRRRRRQLLTNRDYNDLLKIATLPNKDNIKIALAKSLGR